MMDIAQTVFGCDPNILQDAQNYRQDDLPRLLRRLDVLHCLSVSSRIEGFTDHDKLMYIDALVQTYVKCADSIKLARAVEKLWKPLLPQYKDSLDICFDKYIHDIVKPNQIHSVTKFSVLLEQNKIVQDLVKRELSLVVKWVVKELHPLLDIPPAELSVSQCQFIYTLVKIILQLFQTAGAELAALIVQTTTTTTTTTTTAARLDDEAFNSSLTDNARQLRSSLLHILCVKGYQTDCVLLSGTATALMLNSLHKTLSQSKSEFQDIMVSILKKVGLVDLVLLLQENDYDNCSNDGSITCSIFCDTDMGQIALLRGVVACGSNDILLLDFMNIQGCDTSSTPLVITIFRYISSLCLHNIHLSYHCFQIFSLWYQKFSKLIHIDSETLTPQIQSIIQQTLDIVILNWDSPVEDVPETVVDIFDHMMIVWTKISAEFPEFPWRIVAGLLGCDWTVKGKYRILAVLLKYVDQDVILKEYKDIQTHLLQCLTTNHLASTSANVYKAFLTKTQSSSDALTLWKTNWMDTVIEGLVHENSLVYYNTSLHWIPVTLGLVPETTECLQARLTRLLEDKQSSICYTRLLQAWVMITKNIRQLYGQADLENRYVREALHYTDEDVRSDAISLVCSTLKKAEPISTIEISLMQEALTYNIKIDSAPFRQHLGSDVRKLLTRLRDSCITALKAPDKNADMLVRCAEFVDWLHQLCMDYLLPGACYQRRKGSLDLLHVIYECLMYRPDDKHRKGFTPESAVQLLSYARSQGKWSFFSEENISVLVLCILDGATEIQNSAFSLLTKYYNVAADNTDCDVYMLACHLLKQSLCLCNSPKGHESDSGAVLCKLVFQKFVISRSVTYMLKFDDAKSTYKVGICHGETGTPLEFIQELLDETKRQMKLANENLVTASKKYPVHGLISAISRCITETPDLHRTVNQEESVMMITQLVEFCQEVINKMLNIMASVAQQEACPSFAEIGVALETLLQENQSDYSESTSQSPEFQYMLSWCWNNINESCTCLGDVTHTVVQSSLPLSHVVVESVSSTFITVLTKCRHKGVIEGCRTAFVKFCTSLFTSNEKPYYSLPASILTQVLTSLKNKIISSSVTRRSAGIPIIVQAVLLGEKKVKKTCLLMSAVETLFEIAQLPLDVDSGQTDLPQVHGLNILNSLFSDASLSGSLTASINRAVVMVITEFGSPSWAVRNAATRFFSTLVTRIFGQKKTSDSSLCNTVTYQELSSYYPELPPFMMRVLREASSGDIRDIGHLHPGLFPILTLLSCLSPPNTQSDKLKRDIEEMRNQILPFLASPVYQLRHLVAGAMVSMVNMVDDVEFVEDMVGRCDKNTSCNLLHGTLLCMVELTKHVTSERDINRLYDAAVRLVYVVDHKPMIVAAVYVKLMTSFLSKVPDIVTVDDFNNYVKKASCGTTQTITPGVGDGVLIAHCVNFRFVFHQSIARQSSEMANVSLIKQNGEMARLLKSECTESRRACLEYMMAAYMSCCKQRENQIMRLLCYNLVHETDIHNMCTMLQLITKLYLNVGHGCESIEYLQDWFNTMSGRISQYMSLYAASLPVQGIILAFEIQTQDPGLDSSTCTSITEWCVSLVKNSSVTNETQRLAVTQALLIAGQTILNAVMSHESLHYACLCILDCSMSLVQDEDTDIRQEACKFVSSLKWQTDTDLFKYDSLHSNICYELLLEYIVTQFHDSSSCMEFLIGQLYTQGHLAKVIQDKHTARFQQLFEQEDNSFFAEKIYNAFSIFKILKKALRTRPSSPVRSSIVSLHEDLTQDLDTLTQLLHNCTKGSLINMCTDHTILASICSLLLMCDLTEDQHFKDKISEIFKLNVLPKNFQRQVTECMGDS